MLTRRTGFYLVLVMPISHSACNDQDRSNSAGSDATPVVEQTSPTIPAYTVLDIVDQLSGVRYADVLISAFSRDTAASRRADVLQEIAQREGFGEVSLYCSRDAYQANFSSSYSQSHPEALPTCFLGSLKGRQFTPGEALYPDEN